MTIRQLIVFHTVCQEMNYSRAAEKCFISRQALRQNIEALESDLGGLLFDNESNHITLTAKGKKLLEESAAVLKEFERLEAVMQQDNPSRSQIHLGISHSLVPDYLPDLSEYIGSFQRLYPSLVIKTEYLTNDEIAPAILSGVLDCGLVLDLRTSVEGILRTELSSHKSALLVSEQNSVLSKKAVTKDSLKQQTVCLPGKGAEFSPFVSWGQTIAIQFRVVLHHYELLYLVRSQNAFGLTRYVPSDYKKQENVSLIPLEDLPPFCSSFVCSKKNNDTAIRHLRIYLYEKIYGYFHGLWRL